MPTLTKPRKKKDVTIRSDLYQWIEEQIEEGKFRNFSHAIEIALEKLRDSRKKETLGEFRQVIDRKLT